MGLGDFQVQRLRHEGFGRWHHGLIRGNGENFIHRSAPSADVTSENLTSRLCHADAHGSDLHRRSTAPRERNRELKRDGAKAREE
eukprot:68275-Chlamydomonas_euryale.AAC.5